MSFSSSPYFRSARTLCLAALLIAVAPISSLAQTPATPPKKELSEKVHAAIQNLGKLQAESKWDELITQIDALLATADPISFDTAFLSQFKVQALLSKADYANSIPPLETALKLSQQYGYFGDKDLELLWLLAQLYGQEAQNAKDKEVQRANFAKAYTTLRRWLDLTPKPNPDAPRSPFAPTRRWCW